MLGSRRYSNSIQPAGRKGGQYGMFPFLEPSSPFPLGEFISVWWFLLNRKHPIFPTATFSTNIADLLFHTWSSWKIWSLSSTKKRLLEIVNLFYWMISFMLFFCYILNPLFVCIDILEKHIIILQAPRRQRPWDLKGGRVGWLFGYIVIPLEGRVCIATVLFV